MNTNNERFNIIKFRHLQVIYISKYLRHIYCCVKFSKNRTPFITIISIVIAGLILHLLSMKSHISIRILPCSNVDKQIARHFLRSSLTAKNRKEKNKHGQLEVTLSRETRDSTGQCDRAYPPHALNHG